MLRVILFGLYWLACQIWFWLAFASFKSTKRRFEKAKRESKDPASWEPFQRLDNFGRIQIARAILGSLTILPFRLAILLTIALSNLLCLSLLSRQCTLDVTLRNLIDVTASPHENKELISKLPQRDTARQQWFMSKLRWLMGKHCRAEMFFMGVTTVREHRVLNCNFDFTSDEAMDKIIIEDIVEEDQGDIATQTPKCYVSNHVSFIDILVYIWKIYPSFVAKAVVNKQWIVGPCARALNCIFLNRESSHDREATLKVIRERQDQIWKISLANFLRSSDGPSEATRKFLETDEGRKLDPKPHFNNDTPSIVVFAEGTTSSGRHIMPLKRGAFYGLRPISPIVLIYRCPDINVSYELMPLTWTFPLLFSSWRGIQLDVYWLRDVLPPCPLEGDCVSRVEKFSNDVRKRMSRVMVAEAHWPMENVSELPESWKGSLSAKAECLKTLMLRR